MLDVHEALRRLEELDPRAGRVVELRVFGGLTHAEIAEAVQVSVAKARREWEAARTWLYSELRDRGPGERDEP